MSDAALVHGDAKGSGISASALLARGYCQLAKTLVDQNKEILIGKRGVHRQMNAPHTHPNAGAHFEEFGANRADLSLGESGVVQGVAQEIEQNVGKGVEPQAQLIIIKIMVGGTVTEQVELLFFDAILHVPSGTVLLLV